MVDTVTTTGITDHHVIGIENVTTVVEAQDLHIQVILITTAIDLLRETVTDLPIHTLLTRTPQVV